MTEGWVLGPLPCLLKEKSQNRGPSLSSEGPCRLRGLPSPFFVLSCLRACYLLVAEDFLGIIPKGRDVKCMPNLLFLLKGEILGQVDLSWHQTVPTWGRG